MRRILKPLICLVPFFLPQETLRAQEKIRVAAASDLKFAIEELKTHFLKSHPKVELEIVIGASGSLVHQIAAGAPFDLFLAADRSFAEKVSGSDRGFGKAFAYAQGHVVLWSHSDKKLNFDEKKGLKNLEDPRVKKIAIANPETAPYGKASLAGIKAQGLFVNIEKKLVFAESVAQAAQFALAKASDGALIAKSLASSPELQARGSFIELPEIEPLEQSGVILAAAKNKKNVAAFRDLLLSDEGQGILSKYGLARKKLGAH